MNHARLPLWSAANTQQHQDKLHGLIMDLYRLTLSEATAHITAMLHAHPCADEKERADVAFILRMMEEHPNVLCANCEAAHITGSALVIHGASRRVLLNHHKKFDRWMQFGGHPENETEPWRVALREAREESGLHNLQFLPPSAQPVCFDVDVHTIPTRDHRPEHFHLDLRYLLIADAPNEATATNESHEIRWFELGKLDVLELDPGVRRMIGKAAHIMGWI